MTPCTPVILYSNDFETGSGLSDWTVELDFGTNTDDWRGIQSCTAHSGSRSFRFGGPACDQNAGPHEQIVAFPKGTGTAGIAVPATTSRTRLSFWHHWNLTSGDAWLKLAVDGSARIHVPSSAFIGGAGYTEGTTAFTGQQSTFVNSVVDLDAACAIVLGSGGCAGHRIEIGFTVWPSEGPGAEWSLDDVTVTVCAAHGCTGSPAIGTATTPANNQVRVTWSNGTPPSTSFNVYRSLGTCAAPGPAETIGTAVAGSSFLDTNASGGTTFAYRVAGLNDGGFCESDPSGCVEAAPTGPCTLPPTFAGLTAATDPGLTTCALNLSWAAGSSRCGGAVTYTVYRGTTPDFLPGPANAVASGINTTSFSDPGPLTNGADYFYVVRAVDSTNGANDGNLQYLSASPSGPTVFQGTLTDTFEGTRSGGGFDLAGWTHRPLTGTEDWTWNSSSSQSPSHSWFAPQHGSSADQILVSPPFVPQSGSSLSFWHIYDFEFGYEGGTLEISTNHGTSWSVVPDSAFTTGFFNTTLFNGTTDPIAGLRAWSGLSSSWTQVQVDLSSWAGSEIQLRWHSGEDDITGHTGWFVDSVTISNAELRNACLSTPPALSFYTLTPCRLADTRNASGPLGGPALQPGAIRPFTLTGICGVPATAKALSLNVTVTQPSAAGFLTLYPGGQPTPPTSSINFSQGQTRANNAVLPLGDGTGILQIYSAGGSVHVILDVNGYFQ